MEKNNNKWIDLLKLLNVIIIQIISESKLFKYYNREMRIIE